MRDQGVPAIPVHQHSLNTIDHRRHSNTGKSEELCTVMWYLYKAPLRRISEGVVNP